MTTPAILLPFVLLTLSLTNNIRFIELIPIYLIPILWGAWNVMYFDIGQKCLIKKQNYRLFVTGASLGFIIAILAVFRFNILYSLFNLTGPITYLPLVCVPLLYGLVWRYCVKYINSVVGLNDK